MKKYLCLFLLFLLMGCEKKQEKENIIARINNHEITLEEFEEEYKNSMYASDDNPQSRIEFLNNLITRKLILQDAQRKGLDKDKDFLRMIERFWEQSLVKLALDKKSKEIVSNLVIDNKEIKDTYEQMLKENKNLKSYEEIYSQLKWEVIKSKEKKYMQDWLDSLRKEAKVIINYKLIGQK